MLATLLLIAVFGTYTRSTNIEDTWFDDIDGPNFLRGVEQEPKQGRNLDFTNHWPRDSTASSSSSDNYMTSSPSTSSENIVCKVAAHPFGINTTRKQRPVTIINDIGVHCQPFLTVVEVSKLHVKTLFPSHIQLHRCMGYCHSDKTNCTVTKQDEINVTLHDLQDKFKAVYLTMFNHTACQCNCTERESDCDAKIQEYDISNCECKCKLDGSHCSASQTWNTRTCQCECRSQDTCRLDQIWNDSTCQCECRSQDTCRSDQIWNDSACQCQCRNHDTCNATSSHIWNDSTCKCDCVKKVKDRCMRKGKVLNKKKCECECPKPRPVCDAGTSFLKYNCTCV